jgi:pimeloyl-ACP methyl ester carboxylesterase
LRVLFVARSRPPPARPADIPWTNVPPIVYRSFEAPILPTAIVDGETAGVTREPVPTVLLHGLFDDRQMWEMQVRHLADVAESLTIDLTEHETMAAYAEMVLDMAPASFALAGFSMGGYVALEILRRAPERVLRLALLDTSARGDTAEQASERRRRIGLVEAGQYEALVDESLPRAVHPSRVDEKVLMGALRDMALRIGPDAFVRQLEAIMSRADSRDCLDRIRCPTLVICGRQDTVTPPALAEELGAGIPGARVVLVDECNHYSPMERPYAVSALLREWLLYPASHNARRGG